MGGCLRPFRGGSTFGGIRAGRCLFHVDVGAPPALWRSSIQVLTLRGGSLSPAPSMRPRACRVRRALGGSQGPREAQRRTHSAAGRDTPLRGAPAPLRAAVDGPRGRAHVGGRLQTGREGLRGRRTHVPTRPDDQSQPRAGGRLLSGRQGCSTPASEGRQGGVQGGGHRAAHEGADAASEELHFAGPTQRHRNDPKQGAEHGPEAQGGAGDVRKGAGEGADVRQGTSGAAAAEGGGAGEPAGGVPPRPPGAEHCIMGGL
mmetsp:Transcript_41595/g.96484  ORF Transcript_41595/g.96484 Transcript_41595/m.96484 type:complete len:259 (-) Transcript_41595:197-973(-)